MEAGVKHNSILQQAAIQCNGLYFLAMLVAIDETIISHLQIKQKNLTHRVAAFNPHLQMDNWSVKQHVTCAIFDENTEEKLENLDLVKQPELKDWCMASLANEVRRLVEGILDIKGKNTIYFIVKLEIPQENGKN